MGLFRKELKGKSLEIEMKKKKKKQMGCLHEGHFIKRLQVCNRLLLLLLQILAVVEKKVIEKDQLCNVVKRPSFITVKKLINDLKY